jgi:hypothetical protein
MKVTSSPGPWHRFKAEVTNPPIAQLNRLNSEGNLAGGEPDIGVLRRNGIRSVGCFYPFRGKPGFELHTYAALAALVRDNLFGDHNLIAIP